VSPRTFSAFVASREASPASPIRCEEPAASPSDWARPSPVTGESGISSKAVRAWTLALEWSPFLECSMERFRWTALLEGPSRDSRAFSRSFSASSRRVFL
jgi:hypothetical protein